MVAKILFTSNFNFLKIVTVVLLGGNFSFCLSNTKWIRELPNSYDQKNLVPPMTLGIYTRPLITKSAMGAKSHRSIVKEWIEFKEGNRFIKKYLHLESENDKHRVEIRIGFGTFGQVGPWVLLSTKNVQKKTCDIAFYPETTINYDFEPCSMIRASDSLTHHTLLYHYDHKEGSIAHLQYESGYAEADFGIVWEVTKAYEENELFKKIRAKYTKKEFQPHVYYNGRLD